MSDWDNEWSGTDYYSLAETHEERKVKEPILKKKYNFRLSKTKNCIKCTNYFSEGYKDICKYGFYIGYRNKEKYKCDNFKEKEVGK